MTAANTLVRLLGQLQGVLIVLEVALEHLDQSGRPIARAPLIRFSHTPISAYST